MAKTEARRNADRRFEESRVQIAVRFTPEEAAQIDALRGAGTRTTWVQETVRKALKRAHVNGKGKT